MKRDDVFPSKYLKTEDLRGQTVALHISTVILEEIGQDPPKSKPVCYFVGKQKGMVLNQTKWSILEEVYGEDSDSWAGKPITIGPGTTAMKGKVVPCILIKVEHHAGPTQWPVASSPATAQAPPSTPVTPVAQAEGFVETITAADQDVLPDDSDVPF